MARRHLHETVSEPAHLLSPPARYRPVIDALRLVGHHEVFADSDDLAEPSAHRTCPERGIEAEKVFVRKLETYAVEFEAVAEFALRLTSRHGRLLHAYPDMPASRRKGRGYRRQQSRTQVFVGLLRHPHPVYQKVCLFGVVAVQSQDILDLDRPAAREQPGISLLLERQHELHLVGASLPAHVREHIACFALAGKYVCEHVGLAVAADLPSRYGRIGASYACEDQAYVVVYLCRCRDSGTGVPCRDLLLYRYRRGYAVYGVHIGLRHPAEELPRVRRQALRETPLTLCVKGVEHERRFP